VFLGWNLVGSLVSGKVVTLSALEVQQDKKRPFESTSADKSPIIIVII